MHSAFAAVQQDEEHVEGEAWGVEGDLLLDEDGNPEMDEMEIVGAEGDGDEDGWDVSYFFLILALTGTGIKIYTNL